MTTLQALDELVVDVLVDNQSDSYSSKPHHVSIIPQTIASLKEFSLKQIVPGHCTGFRAVNALLNEFGEEVVVPSQVGSRYTFK